LGLVAFIPKWVGDGVVNDGNNLWIAIWLWPEDPPEKGIIISELKIEKSTLTDCQGNDLKNSPWADYVVTKNSFLKKDFLKSDQQKNGAAFKASGQDKFDSGLYFSLVDTKFKAGFKGANLKNCQKGEITMTFKYSLRRMLSDDEEDYFNEPKPLTSHESDISFPFDPEISHKPYSLYPVDFDFARRCERDIGNSAHISVLPKSFQIILPCPSVFGKEKGADPACHFPAFQHVKTRCFTAPPDCLLGIT
jgi:hypothetical protein